MNDYDDEFGNDPYGDDEYPGSPLAACAGVIVFWGLIAGVIWLVCR